MTTNLRLRLRDGLSEVRVARGALSRLGVLMRRAGIAPGACAIVSDTKVARLYGAKARTTLARAGYRPVALLTVPSGERSKSLARAASLYRAFAKLGLERGRPVVALGGGVVGDLAGFVASTWLRGVPLVMVPTTVLAQVDSSVGGKTGVNLPEGKNLVGTFHQPRLVVIDPNVLATLPVRHVRAGLAEAAKMGFAVDRGLVPLLERDASALRKGGRDAVPALARAIARAVRAKAKIVTQDEREDGLRQLLNYGHTAGHALETLGDYRRWLHGEAVAIGMTVAAGAAVRRGILSKAVAARQVALLEALGLPSRLPAGVSARKLFDIMKLDKKSRAGSPRFVLTRGVGVASFGQPLNRSEVLVALQDAGAER